MAQVNITAKVSINEANLLLKLCAEGKETRQAIAKQLRHESQAASEAWGSGNPKYEAWRRAGEEILAIEAIERGLKG